MILYDIKDEDSLLRDTAQSKLSILVGMDSFSYLLQHPERGMHWYRSFALDDSTGDHFDHLEKLLRGEVALQRSFSQVQVACQFPVFTIIPDRLFRAGEERSYLEHLTILKDSDEVLTEALPPAKGRMVYVVPGRVHQLLRRFLPGSSLHHFGSLFINHFGNLHFSGSGENVYLHITSNRLFALHFREGQLNFQNTFTFQSSKDCIYFVLLVFDQLQLDPQSTQVYLGGQLMTDSEIYRLLDRYLAKMDVLELPYQLSLAEPLRAYPPFFYFDHALNLL